MEALSNEFEGRVKFVKVDVDANQEVASRYEIMSIPTIMLFENGRVEDSIVGAYPASVYKQHIERALNRGSSPQTIFGALRYGSHLPNLWRTKPVHLSV